ncbi:ANTAR domain-containing protein, partial [Auraticoccus cholistanensis]|uniref:ANTAR domain-containing protein n=1 Tax=Auraticoccus cholistanensis TaxID=2656650 RepID=UPI0018D24AB2
LWWWSKGVYALLGREQDALAPSTALLLHHVDPAHRAEVRAMLQEAPERGVAARIQVQTASRRPRTVILTLGPDGCPETERPSWLKRSVAGSLLDVTDSERHASTRAVRAATNHRATIEQAKGIAMTVYGLSEDAAFLLLSYFSQSRNLRLHQVAQQLVDQAARLTPGRDCRRLAEGILAGDQDAAARVPRS